MDARRAPADVHTSSRRLDDHGKHSLPVSSAIVIIGVAAYRPRIPFMIAERASNVLAVNGFPSWRQQLIEPQLPAVGLDQLWEPFVDSQQIRMPTVVGVGDRAGPFIPEHMDAGMKGPARSPTPTTRSEE